MCVESDTPSIWLANTYRDNETVCAEVDGISITPVPEHLGVTDINNEACTAVEIGVKERTSFVMPTAEYQNLREYFERPRLVFSGSIATTRTSMVAVGVTPLVLWYNWFPNALIRMAGVYGVRFTMRFTVTVAATPFQQAVCAQSFQYGVHDTTTGPTVTFQRFGNSAMVTNLPHVIHDLAETTMTQFDVPFLYAKDFLPLYGATNTDTLGTYAFNTLMPYRTIAGVNSPTYKIMVSLHDLDLIGSFPQTVSAVVTQSGAAVASAKMVYSRQKGNKAPLQQEKAKLTGSTILSGAATAVKTFGPYIPFLSSVSGPTSMALEAASSVARAFGFSKPQVEQEPNRVYRSDYIAEGNTDVPSNSYVVAPFQRNQLKVDQMAGGTDVDEMSFGYVLSQPCQTFVGNFSTTDAVGVTLYASNVCPTNFWFRTNSSRPGGNLPLPAGATLTTNSMVPTTMCYLATHFRYWRGSMKFTFTFSKTKFHAGRVIAAFVPTLSDVQNNGILTTTVQTIENSGFPQPFSYCKIFDLRDASSFEFEVPYISPTPYTNVLSATGGITLTVLDPLVTSGEIASTVDYMVEVAAGDDFTFGCVAPPMLSPASVTGTGLVFYQSGLAGGVEKLPDNVDEYTVGETFKSIKSLIMLPSYISGDCPASAITSTTLPPFWVRSRWTMATPMPNNSTLAFAFTRSGNFAACYAFATGSTEWHSYHNGPKDDVVTTFSSNERDANTPASGPGDPRFRGGTSGLQRLVTTDSSLHARFPSYQRVTRVPIPDVSTAFTGNFQVGNAGANGSQYCQNFAQHQLTNQTPANVRVFLGRAAADDARLVGWLGPPPVVLFQGTQSVAPDSNGVSAF